MKDPYTCMGVGITANGYDLGYICSNRHGHTNKWSRHKPVPGAPSGSNILYPNENTGWFKGNDGKCGLDVYTSNNMQGLANYVLARTETDRWKYVPPKGGDNEPYRLLDFDGYMHNAIKPLYRVTDYNGAYPPGNYEYPRLRVYYMYNDVNPSLFLTDILINGSPLGNWYLGAIFVNSATGVVLCGACNQNPLGDPSALRDKFGSEDDPFVIPLLAEWGGFESLVNYTMIPILSKNKKLLSFKQNEVAGSDLFCDLPINNGNIYMYSRVNVGCYLEDRTTYWDDYGIHYEVLGQNDTDEDVDLGNFTVELWTYDRDDKNITYKLMNLERSYGSFIPANTEGHLMRVGAGIEWGTYNGVTINVATAYNVGYFIKLVGEDITLFPTYVSRKIVDGR